MHRTGRSGRPVVPGLSESSHTGAAQELGLRQNQGAMMGKNILSGSCFTKYKCFQYSNSIEDF